MGSGARHLVRTVAAVKADLQGLEVDGEQTQYEGCHSFDHRIARNLNQPCQVVLLGLLCRPAQVLGLFFQARAVSILVAGFPQQVSGLNTKQPCRAPPPASWWRRDYDNAYRVRLGPRAFRRTWTLAIRFPDWCRFRYGGTRPHQRG